MTPKLSDAEELVSELLKRYNSALEFHQLRACFMGAIACPAMGINPTRLIRGFWGREFHDFQSLEDANSFFDVLINRCWNPLTAHTNPKNPFELTQWRKNKTTKDLAEFSSVRTEELAIFIEAVEGPDDELKLPRKALTAVRALEEIYEQISGIEALAHHKWISKNPDEIGEMFDELSQLTMFAEKEINAAIIACHRAQKTYILHLPKVKDRIH